MEALGWLLWDWLIHLPYLLVQPLFYLLLVLTFFIYRRQVELERSLFHIKLFSAGERWWSALLLGLLEGLVLSLLIAVLGLTFRIEDLLWVSGLALLLSFFQLRFLCFSYGAGLLSLLALWAQWWELPASWPALEWLWQELAQVDPFSLLFLVALLHLAEAILVRLDGDSGAAPLIVEGKRGQLQGGYYAERFWVLPLLLPIFPVMGLDATTQLPADWPLLLGAGGTAFLFFPFPATIGYSRLILARPPAGAKRQGMWESLLYSGVLFLLLLGAFWWTWLLIVAALWTIGAHEWFHYRQQAWEWEHRPYFVPKEYGVKILSILPASPAAAMELEAGEVIVKVNGSPVNNRKELYAALQQEGTGTEVHLEVEDVNGNLKLAQRPLYSGEHHQLGIIAVPDEETEFYVDWRGDSLWNVLRQRWKRLQRSRLQQSGTPGV